MRTATIAAVLAAAGSAVAGPVTIGFDFDPLNQPLLKGQVIDNEFGPELTISAVNNNAGHPHKAIIFDSASPTGGDMDLKTPGYHPTNTTPLGKLLIIAENVTDTNNDGYVDNPDDEAAGGMIAFQFNGRTFDGYSITLVDIEEQNGSIQLVAGGAVVATHAIPNVGDNSVQTLAASGVTFDEMRVNLAGSGAIGAVSFVPAPGSLALLGCAGLLVVTRRRR